MSRIGFIGLGHMGLPVVVNIIKAGHAVCVYDISASAVEAAAACGASVASNLAELCEHAEVIITMVQTGEQVSSLLTADDGCFSHARPGTLFIDCSSIDVMTSRQLHDLAAKQGFQMVDAPVSGGVAGAKAASLTIMVGGTDAAYAAAQPILATYGKKIVSAGQAGNGQAAKICNNMILGISMIAVSEAFTLAEQLGLPAEKLFEISSNASGQCWSMTSYSPVPGLVDNVPANNNYQPGFTAAMMLKDLNLSQAAAESVSAATPLGTAATELYQKFIERGNGDMDFSGIIKMLRGL